MNPPRLLILPALALALAAFVPAQTTTWTGATNADWSDPGNWSAGVPDETRPALIPAGLAVYPAVTSGGVALDLTVATGAALDVGTSTTLAVHRDLTNAGTITGPGRIRMVGAAHDGQLAGPGTFPVLSIGKAAGRIVDSSAGPVDTGILELESGELRLFGPVSVATNFAAWGGTLSTAGGLLDVNGEMSGDIVRAAGPVTILIAGAVGVNGMDAPAATLVLDGALSNSSFLCGAATLGNLVVASGTRGFRGAIRAASVTVQTGAEMRVGPTQNGSRFAVDAPAFDVHGLLGVGWGSILELSPATALHVTAAGILEVLGYAWNLPAIVAGNPCAGYSLVVDGHLRAHGFTFRDMSPTGVRITTNATIAAAPDDLRSGTFENPAPGPGARCLEISRPVAATIEDVAFQERNGSSGTLSVACPGGAPIVFERWSGNRGGPAHEVDPLGLVSWGTAAGATLATFTAVVSGADALLTLSFATQSGVIGYDLEWSVDGGPWTGLTQFIAPSAPMTLQQPRVAGVNNSWRLMAFLESCLRVPVPGIASLGPPISPIHVTPATLLRVGPAEPFTTVQAALAAATLPDTVILVDPGLYPRFTIGPAVPARLRIVSSTNVGGARIDTACGPVVVSGIGLGNSVELSNFVFGETVLTGPALEISGCAGPVVVNDAVATSFGPAAVTVTASGAVALQRVNVQGALVVGPASWVAASLGGCYSGSVAAGSVLERTEFSGGVAVAPGGADIERPGTMPQLTLPGVVIPLGTPFDLTFTAWPSATWLLAISFGLGHVAGASEMPLFLDLATLLIVDTRVAPASGTDVIPLALPPDPAFLGLPITVQAGAVNTGTGALRTSNVRTLVGGP